MPIDKMKSWKNVWLTLLRSLTPPACSGFVSPSHRGPKICIHSNAKNSNKCSHVIHAMCFNPMVMFSLVTIQTTELKLHALTLIGLLTLFGPNAWLRLRLRYCRHVRQLPQDVCWLKHVDTVERNCKVKHHWVSTTWHANEWNEPQQTYGLPGSQTHLCLKHFQQMPLSHFGLMLEHVWKAPGLRPHSKIPGVL